jgi:hypothetical protein
MGNASARDVLRCTRSGIIIGKRTGYLALALLASGTDRADDCLERSPGRGPPLNLMTRAAPDGGTASVPLQG